MDAITRVNGQVANLPADDTRLLDWLRDDAGLRGPKEGCGAGHCGSCTVLVDGRSALACCVLTGSLRGCKVTTIEGLVNTWMGRRLIDAFLRHGSLQCGFCTSGMIVSAYAAIVSYRRPLSDDETRQALIGNICRCTGYTDIVAAVMAASRV